MQLVHRHLHGRLVHVGAHDADGRRAGRGAGLRPGSSDHGLRAGGTRLSASRRRRAYLAAVTSHGVRRPKQIRLEGGGAWLGLEPTAAQFGKGREEPLQPPPPPPPPPGGLRSGSLRQCRGRAASAGPGRSPAARSHAQRGAGRGAARSHAPEDGPGACPALPVPPAARGSRRPGPRSRRAELRAPPDEFALHKDAAKTCFDFEARRMLPCRKLSGFLATK